MEKEFLKGLGLDDSVIDSIMAENDKDIESLKNENQSYITELDGIKEQLAQANTQIQAFNEMDIDAIKQATEDYKQKFEESEKNAQEKITKLQFDHALDGALGGAKAKNLKSVKALLDMDGLKFNNGEIIGLSDQLDKIKTENDYLFESDEDIPQIVKGTSGQTSTSVFDSLRLAMGLEQKQ